MTTTRQEEIEQRTIDLLLDKGTLAKVDQNMIKSFATLAYCAEKYKALGKVFASDAKMEAYLLALAELNLKESEVDNLLE